MSTVDEHLAEKRAGWLPRTLLVASAACFVCGLAWWLFEPQSGYALWVLNVGLMTLMTTPLLRVALTLVDGLRLEDWFFVGTTVAVIAELIVTVVDALNR